jgi:SAM-dependent methyltransferase
MTGGSRREFLDRRRDICRRRYDEIHAIGYDEQWGAYCNPTHLRCLAELVDLTTVDAELLDAGCGTGKYWQHLLDRDRRIVGIDQSREMLARARAKNPTVLTQALALQDLRHVADFHGRFDGLLCVDVMENVGPEDWPLVLDGFRTVLRTGSPAYLTVELPEEPITGPVPRGLAPGEVIEDGAYHHYPAPEAVTDWLDDAGFQILTERTGDGYWHLLVGHA